MKYINVCNKTHEHATFIALGEMINICYGKTFYENGIKTKKPRPYNIYNINGIQYEFDLSCAAVIFIGIDVNNIDIIISDLFQKIADEDDRLDEEKSVCVQGTDKNIIVRNRYKPLLHAFEFNTRMYGKNDASNTFTWFIYDSLDKSPLYCKDLDVMRDRKHVQHLNLLASINTIIIDGTGIFDLPSGFKSVDYPNLDRYINTREKLCKEELVFSNHGIGLSLFGDPYFHKKHVDYMHKEVHNDIFWLKWDDIYWKKNNNMEVKWYDQLRNGILYKERGCHEKYPKCFITGTSLYEDCYVFDIYQQTVETDNDGKEKDDNENKTTLINYEKPYRVLISPWVVDYYDIFREIVFDRHYKGFKYDFEKAINGKTIMYRTHCGISFNNAIDNHYKNRNDIFKEYLKAFNSGWKNDYDYIRTTYNNHIYEYDKYHSPELSDLIYKDKKRCFGVIIKRNIV